MPIIEGHHRPLSRRGPLTVASVLPGLAVLRRYDRGWLRGDVLAGVTVAAYLIPQVMAYAQIAGLPPVTGLLAVVGPTIAYAVLGTSRQLSVGPESTTALMTATAVAAVGVSGPDDYAALAAALALVCGVLCLVGWAVGLGFVADLLSKPVLVGYLTGVAVLMIVSQLDTLTGIVVTGESRPAQVWSALTSLDEVHLPTLLLSAALLVLLLVLSRVAPRWPGPLIAVLVGAAAVALFDLGQGHPDRRRRAQRHPPDPRSRPERGRGRRHARSGARHHRLRTRRKIFVRRKRLRRPIRCLRYRAKDLATSEFFRA